MIKINRELWDETIKKLYKNYESSLKRINEFIADLDLSCNSAFVSIKYNLNQSIVFKFLGKNQIVNFND